MSALVFTDTETTGVSPDDHIWEFAAVRRYPNGFTKTWHYFVQHDLNKAKALPESFRADHDARYDASRAVSPAELADAILVAFGGRPHVVGAVPNFDTERYARLLAHYGHLPPWHYHLRDIENMAVGYLLGRAQLTGETLPDLDDSDALSRACGVEPPTTGRHTAMGDVEWCIALWDTIHHQGSEVAR